MAGCRCYAHECTHVGSHARTRTHTQHQVHPQAEDPHVKVRESLKIAGLSWGLCFCKTHSCICVCVFPDAWCETHTHTHIHSKESGTTKHAVCENKGKVLAYRNETRAQSCWLITSWIQTQQNTPRFLDKPNPPPLPSVPRIR